MITFLGTSHAPQTLSHAARAKGIAVTDDISAADLVFISEDTPTSESGVRDVEPIRALIFHALAHTGAPIVLTSQVPPGFTRALGFAPGRIYHQAETLRIKDAMERALQPEMMIVGCPTYQAYDLLPQAYRDYLEVFACPVHVVQYEDAEFAKIAINMFLASQVDTTNRLAKAASRVGANWWWVSQILKNDKRIGPHAYLEPGRWQDSSHLLRDHVTLGEILAR